MMHDQIKVVLFLHVYGSDGACVIVLTGKAPPNLSQGVPPLLPNQYIMGPGGLLPAYPVSRPAGSKIIGLSIFYFQVREHKKWYLSSPSVNRVVADCTGLLFHSRSMAMRTSICSSPDCQWWDSSPHFWNSLFRLLLSSLQHLSLFVKLCGSSPDLFCSFSPLCRITMESHSLAPQPLSLAETGTSPTTPTQVKLLTTCWSCLKS